MYADKDHTQIFSKHKNIYIKDILSGNNCKNIKNIKHYDLSFEKNLENGGSKTKEHHRKWETGDIFKLNF